MSIKPILFNTEMVRGLLDGTKTVTRRVVRLPHCGYFEHDPPLGVVPPYRPGDILYVRETWCHQISDEYPFVYKANVETPAAWKWCPSIHMPQEAARFFLRVTDVRVEKLWDITDEDLVRDFCLCREAIEAVGRDALAGPFWDSTIKPADRELYGWNANPWVWVIEFERCERPEGD